MVNCAAIGCTNRSNDKPELSFHKIPSQRDEDRQERNGFKIYDVKVFFQKMKHFAFALDILRINTLNEICR